MEVKRILSRVYVHDFDQASQFYEQLLNEELQSRFQYPQMNLELGRIGNLLIIAGSEEALQPFRTTQATFLVDSIERYREFLLQNGAVMIRDIREVPTGWNMTVQHEDGTIVEYVEHKSHQG